MTEGADGFKLAPHPKLPKGKKLMLIILDGWGEQIPDEFNAIHRAETPIMDYLKTVRFIFPTTRIDLVTTNAFVDKSSSFFRRILISS